MEEITLNVDARGAEVLRRQIAYACAPAAETLHREADGYYLLARSPERHEDLDETDIASFRASMERVQTWGGLLDALGWNPASDESRTVTAPRGQLQDLLSAGLQIAVERLEELRWALGERRPSEVLRRRAEDMEVYEELLDRVGWPDPKEET